jgi:hypothetical protein
VDVDGRVQVVVPGLGQVCSVEGPFGIGGVAEDGRVAVVAQDRVDVGRDGAREARAKREGGVRRSRRMADDTGRITSLGPKPRWASTWWRSRGWSRPLPSRRGHDGRTEARDGRGGHGVHARVRHMLVRRRPAGHQFGGVLGTGGSPRQSLRSTRRRSGSRSWARCASSCRRSGGRRLALGTSRVRLGPRDGVRGRWPRRERSVPRGSNSASHARSRTRSASRGGTASAPAAPPRSGGSIPTDTSRSTPRGAETSSRILASGCVSRRRQRLALRRHERGGTSSNQGA